MAARRATALAVALFVFGLGEELWFRYLPEYLRTLGASAFLVGIFGTWKDLLDAVYAYPGDTHLFVDSSLPTYDEAQTDLVIERTLEFLAAL